MTLVRAIRVEPTTDGRSVARLVTDPVLPDAVGYESSEYGRSVGRDSEAEAIEYLRRVYTDLPADLPIERYALDGITRV